MAIGENTHSLYYMLEWQSLADHEARWNAFASDPDWIKARAASEKDQAIVAHISNAILLPTEYSPVK